MKVIDQLNQLDRLDALIRRKATGNSRDLASRFHVSERTIYNLLETLKAFGAEIGYCRTRCSYYYVNQIKFRFNAIVEFPEERKTLGGKIYFHNYSLLQNNCRKHLHL
jgi:hypothetical protein